MKVNEIMKYVLENYLSVKKTTFDGSNEFMRKFTKEVPDILYNELKLNKERYLITASCGKGIWATIPWIAIFDKHISSSAQGGYYVVILFNADMSGFFVTLNQGYTWFSEKYPAKTALEKMSIMSENFMTKLNITEQDKIDLKCDKHLAKGYEIGAIKARFFNNYSTDESIKKEIWSMLELLYKISLEINEDYKTYNEKILNYEGTTRLAEQVISYTVDNENIFCLADNSAKLRVENGNYILIKGSHVNKPDGLKNYKFYEKAVEIYDATDMDHKLTKDIEFSTATQAASIANGVFTIGQIAWKDTDGIALEEKEIIDVIKEFKDFYDGFTFPRLEEQLKLSEEYLTEYPLSNLHNLAKEEYVIGNNEKRTLCYNLEFGKYKYLCSSIGGATSKKFGVYMSEGKLKNYDGVIEDESNYWKAFIKELYSYLTNISQTTDVEEFPKISHMLRGMTGMVLGKLAWIYYPHKFINIVSREKLIKICEIFKYKYEEDYTVNQLSFLINNNIRKDIDEITEDNIILGDVLWDYIMSYEIQMEKVDEVDIRYWLYSPGENAFKWEEFYKSGIMAIDYNKLGDLRNFNSKREIREALEADEEEGKRTNDALANWEFANVIKKNDVIFVKKGKDLIIGRGIVESDYIYDETKPDYRSIRKVKWLNNGEWNHFEAVGFKAVNKTLTDITKYAGYPQKLLSIIEGNDNNALLEKYDKNNFLEEVFITSEEYDSMRSTLLRKKNIILQGAPGVGKTFCAKKLMYSIFGQKDESRIETVQFHQSYSYEDFIQGIRPNEEGKFVLENGVFYDLVERAIEAYESAENKEEAPKYCIIIDEINRGNLSKVFGELMMLIEADKRSAKWSINLTYSKKRFFIPPNLYIIGTMNTADRSLSMVDYALRRRFSFITLKPAFENEKLKNYLIKNNNIGKEFVSNLCDKMIKLNQYIESTLNEGFVIGHSYFIDQLNIEDLEMSYEEIVEYEIKPLIEEYYYGEKDKISETLNIIR